MSSGYTAEKQSISLTTTTKLFSKSGWFVYPHASNQRAADNFEAFRPGNIDLPAGKSHAVPADALTLPDMLTEMDLLALLPDPAVSPGEIDSIAGAQDPTLLDWDMQSLITESVE